MDEDVERAAAERMAQMILAIVASTILGYALLTTNTLLGILASAAIVLGYRIVR